MAEWQDASDLHARLGPKPHSWLATAALAWGTLGIIYGDIGTSPLYTFASIFSSVDTVDADDAKMGLSLIFWTLTLVVLFKYVLIVLRADDNGEGGTFALYSRLCRSMGVSPFGTLQAQEHEQLVSMSKRPGLVQPMPTAAWSGSLGHVLAQLQAGAHSSHCDAAHTQQLAATSKPETPLNSVPEDSKLMQAVKHEMVALRLPAGAATAATPHPSLQGPTRWWSWGALPSEPVKRWVRGSAIAQRALLVISVFATSLMLGDGVLTPAVSVVSAISGLTVATESVTQNMVVGISCAILVVLFMAQFLGTDRVSFTFSPVIVLWLASNAAIGIYQLALRGSEAFQGLSPYWIGAFFQRYGGNTSWQMLGSVMLAVTGSEALFADLGHFSYASVSISWVFFAYPCLVLTYLGQAAHLIEAPEDLSTLYWTTVPRAVFWPMLVLATLATIVASQAIISASFSICKQAKALGCFPKMKIVNTSDKHSGQIYVPSVNFILMILTVAIIAGFNADSTRLGNAYGLTISFVMLITTFMVVVLAVVDWRLNALLVLALGALFGLIDGAFASANLSKVEKGGWVALAIGGSLAAMNLIWWVGQRRHRHAVANLELEEARAQHFTFVGRPQAGATPSPAAVLARYAQLGGVLINAYDLGVLRGDLALALKHSSLSDASPMVVMPGIALHFSEESSSAISTVLRHVINNQEAVHQVNLLVTIRRLPVPRIAAEDRMLVRTLPQLPNFYQVITRYGYVDAITLDQDFIRDLVTAVVVVLAEGAEMHPSNVFDGAHESMFEVDRPLGEGVLDVRSLPLDEFRAPNLASISRAGSHPLESASMGVLPRRASACSAVEIQVSSTTNPALAARSVGPSAQRQSVDLSTVSRTVQASLMARLASQAVMQAALSNATTDPSHFLAFMATHAKSTETLPAELEEAALRVEALFRAAQSGCVFYFSRTALRTSHCSNPLRRFLMEHLYRPMLQLSYADHEEWHVPLEHLIEIGMVIQV